ncbi:MAG: 50S ribosomal protein L22 [Candidatus Saganbacteria bacterium]|nr:50S ribosomal protein L22 [Candidatus Saganbacteria bacterium]
MAENVKASAKWLRISPRKVRKVLALLRKKPVNEALTMLKFMPQKGARILEKVIKSAKANATKNYKLDETKLIVHTAYVDGGPVMKRSQPRSRGRAYPILKRASHVTIFVSEKGSV